MNSYTFYVNKVIDSNILKLQNAKLSFVIFHVSVDYL